MTLQRSLLGVSLFFATFSVTVGLFAPIPWWAWTLDAFTFAVAPLSWWLGRVA